jgi:hypothetical protein
LQHPELVPGLVEGQTKFTLGNLLADYRNKDDLLDRIILLVMILAWFLPGWLYRFSLKSTSWFWWPLAYLGGEARLAKTPTKFHRKILGTLWAKTSIGLAFLTVLSFIVVNFIFSGAVFKANPLSTVLGYFLIVDWSPRSWQLFVVALAALSITIVFLVDDANGDYREAVETNDRIELVRVERKFVWIEHLARLRFVFIVLFWILVGCQTGLYFNSGACWKRVPVNVQAWAEFIYGPRTPPPPTCP